LKDQSFLAGFANNGGSRNNIQA